MADTQSKTDSQSKSTAGATKAEATDGVASGIDSAREKIHHLADDMQQRFERASGDVRRGAEKASREVRRGADAARVKVDQASENLRQGYTRARTHADAYSREIGDYVKENPGRSVIAAAAVGFLVGLLFRRRGD